MGCFTVVYLGFGVRDAWVWWWEVLHPLVSTQVQEQQLLLFQLIVLGCWKVTAKPVRLTLRSPPEGLYSHGWVPHQACCVSGKLL